MPKRGRSWCDHTEEELLAAARRAERGAYAELWRRHVGAAIAAVRTLARDAAEDMVAEAFAQLWSQLLAGGGPRQYFRAYLIAVSRNLTARHFQQRRHEVSGLDGEQLDALTGARAAGADEALLRAEEQRLLRAAFDAMPERWRTVLRLQLVEGHSRGEIARQLSLEPNAVSALGRRARAGLRSAWLAEGAGVSGHVIPAPHRVPGAFERVDGAEAGELGDPRSAQLRLLPRDARGSGGAHAADRPGHGGPLGLEGELDRTG
ncbi:RNA polymerase sigma factor [Leucobacter massiliensis]|uniref:RNA polymerase sigma factor 70 region 4 type 2 domain-containing protein n=1 Tax=Leucobacter massiliensis TaxID=1686285 RepID=A0A2S9QS68_9MICO|nr:sigma-70 family RNA polymerase sigma factor [Leucobacter massiliensis]PRI12412.1 hypothetical protein B4915_01720 [Leucobacter massiliensis]